MTGPLKTVAEALAEVVAHARPLAPQRVLLARALGLSLAEDVAADLDLPPFDKALVDGYAFLAADLAEGTRELRVVGEITAGRVFERRIESGEAVSIMTGAPLPPGADAVVMHERTERSGDLVKIAGPIRPGQNRLERGREIRAGEVAVASGTVLNAPKLGALASIGCSAPLVSPRPLVSVVATGDELVPIEDAPGPGRIRNSNSTLLAALMESLGADAWISPVAPDAIDPLVAALTRAIESPGDQARRADVLLVSGGVSAGNRDLVPTALASLGVVPVFHKVEVKPGKPLWFGFVRETETQGRTLVFGLPGNPVSGIVSALLFVAPALAILSGRPGAGPRIERRPLAIDFRYREDRPTYHPARLDAAGAVEPLAWAGSSDLRTVAEADGFVALEKGEAALERGTSVGFLPLP